VDEEGDVFRFDNTDIAAGIIRFGNASYQASNITSLNVRYERKMSNGVQGLLVLAVLSAAAAALLYRESADYSIWLAGAAVAFIVIAAIWQRFWPLHRYTLQIKMTSGEMQPFTSSDRTLVFELKSAIESTFARRL
jgi:hypothetical protein